jgi:hypothetical protein
MYATSDTSLYPALLFARGRQLGAIVDTNFRLTPHPLLMDLARRYHRRGIPVGVQENGGVV